MIEVLFKFLLVVFVLAFLPLFIYIRGCIRFYRYQRYIIYRPYFNIEIKSREKTIEHEEIYYLAADGAFISAWYVPYLTDISPDPATETPNISNTSATASTASTADTADTTDTNDAVDAGNAGNTDNADDADDADDNNHTTDTTEDAPETPGMSESAPAEEETPSPRDTPEKTNSALPGKARGVILFCHGNAGNISQRIDSFKIFHELGFNTFIFDYRGYGKSIGFPSERGTYLDGEGAWNYLVEKLNFKPEEIIIFGRSLGGAIAAYLAQKYQPRALIIESSFTSALDMAGTLYSWLPVKLLTRYNYNTAERLKDIHCPVLIVHSPDDRTIPYGHGQALYEIATPPKKFLRIKGDHLDGFLRSRTVYVEGLQEFINELPKPFLATDTPG